ncbi:MAG: cytochrome c5 family protein [Desulfuromonadales bacterium]|nr:cytochrome c5 family protein [Desulfuromonadales bacterium]
MKKNAWHFGLLAALLILPACDRQEEPPKEPAAVPQQQVQPVQPPMTSEQAMPPSGAMPMAESMAKGDIAVGEKVYNQACSSCHDEGISGAPKIGDSAAWAERIAKGMEALNKNSINGFTGETGMMPAKGGFSALSDDEVKAAVEYMVSQSK